VTQDGCVDDALAARSPAIERGLHLMGVPARSTIAQLRSNTSTDDLKRRCSQIARQMCNETANPPVPIRSRSFAMRTDCANPPKIQFLELGLFLRTAASSFGFHVHDFDWVLYVEGYSRADRGSGQLHRPVRSDEHHRLVVAGQ
jgi:hypothetical protein